MWSIDSTKLQVWKKRLQNEFPEKSWPSSRSAHTLLSLFDPDSNPSDPAVMVAWGVNSRGLHNDMWIFCVNVLEWRKVRRALATI